MSLAFRSFPTLGVVALFTEAAGGGEALDPSAACNAPAYAPESNLDKIKLHSSLDNFEAVADVTVTVNHVLVAANPSATDIVYATYTNSTLIYTHGLGIVPYGKATVAGQAISSSYPVQSFGDGRSRIVCARVTSTGVYIDEYANATNVDLPAISVDYRIILKGAPRFASGSDLLNFAPATGVLKLGFDRFSSDRKYLQVVPTSTLGLAAGKSIDLANGGARYVNPDGTHTDEDGVQHFKLNTLSPSYGPEPKYNGTFTGSGAILVSVP